ncbi:site-specific integrase [Alicyclobacillus shizuokensis]|uniref:site-specific integrase n=1 Tax=Alicyclobacillus shizuokensis TaxID=392014 RepID=UPI0008295560|nr:site-specific integrase [Alicyclobacillus shizuokensis]
MARVYKRGKKWAYVVYAGKNPVTGKDKQITKSGFLTKKDAQLAAAIVERQLHNREYLEPSNITFADLCGDWERHYQAQGAKASSVRARKIALKHVINAIGQVPVQRITKKAYQDMIDSLADRFSPNYVSSIHTSAHMVFTYAQETGLIRDVPSAGVRLPKRRMTVEDIEQESALPDKFLEREELEEFLLVAKREGLEGDLLAFTMLAYTGLRIGELAALKWSDIDFDNLTLRVARTYFNPTNSTKKFQVLPPKTKSSIRTIPIDPVLVPLLRAHQREQEQLKKSPFYQDQGFIFTTNEGYPKTIKHFHVRLKRLLKKTSITKNITPHSFRHTHTSLLIEANVHIKEIQERLGHSDIQTTMDIYAHMTKNIKRDAAQKFGDFMRDVSDKLL